MDAKQMTWNSRRKLALVGFGVVATAGLCFLAGLYVGGRSAIRALGYELNGTQAMLAFNRLDDERRVQSLLGAGCIPAAQKQLDIDEDQNKALLAEFFSDRTLPAWARRYVLERDPNLAKNLATFKSKYGNVWEQPDCKNTKSWPQSSPSGE